MQVGESELTFDAPGAGYWRLDLDHCSRPVRRVGWDCYSGAETGTRQAYAAAGLAVTCIRIAYVHGWPYGQMEPVDRAEELLHREAHARAAVERGTWREVVDGWFEAGRGAFIDRCLALQRRLDAAPDDAASCADLVVAAGELATDGITEHFALSAGYLGAGLFLDQHPPGPERAGALAALAGSSPGSREPAELAGAVASALGDDIARVATVEEVAAHSPEAARALEHYLERFGSRSLDGTPDGGTLSESPDLLLATLRASAGRQPSGPDASIPLDVARSYGLRDDNVGITCNWPPGLLRRAVMHAGTVLHEAGRLDDAEYAFHLSVADLAEACENPTADMNGRAARAAAVHAQALAASPPVGLDGGSGERVELEIPPFVARASAAMNAYRDPVPRPGADEELRGVGVGAVKVRGRARVALDAVEAIESVGPDEILVTPVTDSAFNVLLSMVAGLVTEFGGAMSHAALMARELEIPAVVGVADAVGRIPDGELIELDPAEGTVTIIGPS